MDEKETKMKQNVSEAGVYVSNMVPSTIFFEARFEVLRNNYEIVRQAQDSFSEQLRDLKRDIDSRFNQTHVNMSERFIAVDKRFEQVDMRFEQVDKRFEQVDKRFDQVDKRFEQVDKRFEQIDMRLLQIITSIEKLGDKIDLKDERQRKFTLKMFSIAMSFTGLSILGILIKVLNII